MDNQLERILYELDNEIQWQSDKHSSGMSFEDFSKSEDSPEILAELFLYCYEQPPVKPQIARCKQARKWHDILELLEGLCFLAKRINIFRFAEINVEVF